MKHHVMKLIINKMCNVLNISGSINISHIITSLIIIHNYVKQVNDTSCDKIGNTMCDVTIQDH